MPESPSVPLDIVLTGARLATGEDASIACRAGRIAWVGPSDALPGAFDALPVLPCEGRLVTPGFIDCHTHLVHAGSRADEWAQRLRGATYVDIARAGGGIRATVRATRAASEEDLVASALPRLDALIAEGVTMVEIKSGYGLDTETELRMLRVARQLGTLRPVRVRTSFLGAHAVPEEYNGRPDAYLDEVVLPTLRRAHADGLVDAVDAFCEGIAFTPPQVQRVFACAQQLGLPVKLHAEQLSRSGATALAAAFGALSADHLEHAHADDAAALAASGTVAVLLPGAYYVLRETRVPPVQALREHGVPIAIATDCNPGTSPLSSLRLAMHLACTDFGLTPGEALDGVTVHAARALGVSDAGRIAVGLRADLAVWNASSPAELIFPLGLPSLHRRLFADPS